MVPTLVACALALAPAQPAAPAGPLSVANARTTYGILGPARADTRYLPGDIVFMAFEIDGLRTGPDGRIAHGMSMEVLDGAGKTVFGKPASTAEQIIPLAGGKLPARAFYAIGPDQPAGKYTCKVTVVDPASKTTKAIETKFEVLPKGFGIVSLFTTYAPKADELPAPLFGITGQNIYINFALVGFARSPAKKPDLLVEMRIADDKSQLTLPTPLKVIELKDLDEKDDLPGFTVPLPLNREGNFALELKATDRLTGKSSTVVVPVRVLPALAGR